MSRTNSCRCRSETLPGLLSTAVAEYADAIAFTQCMPNGMNGSLRYREVDGSPTTSPPTCARWSGSQPGDRVAVQMPNCLSYPVVAFGVLKAGCVLVNTNPLYTALEMTHQFSDSGARVLVIIDMFADRLPEVLPDDADRDGRHGAGSRSSSRRWSPASSATVQKRVEPVAADRSRSRTPRCSAALAPGASRGAGEGRPRLPRRHRRSTRSRRCSTPAAPPACRKGAMLSHGNLVSNTMQMLRDARHAHPRPARRSCSRRCRSTTSSPSR